MYDRVATAYAVSIENIFSSEDTLSEAFHKHYPHLKFDRTDHGRPLLVAELNSCFKLHGPEVPVSFTSYDRKEILKRLADKLDYNLYSQVLLNLQDYNGVVYSSEDAESLISDLEGKWKDKAPNPFDAKARMIKTASTTEDNEFNAALSIIKAAKIVRNFGPGASFRVSPKGSTPALADSRNISMLGIGGDTFLRLSPGLSVYYLCWEPGTTPVVTTPLPDGTFVAEGIAYPFQSKSGGDMLNEVLFSRKVAVSMYKALGTQAVVIPRLNSVMLVTASSANGVEQAANSLPVVKLIPDTRIPKN